MAVDKKISQLASGAPAQAGDEYVVARSGANYKLTLTNIAASMPPIGATTPNTGSFTSLTNSGNLTFSSTAQRITGDFSNATRSNRLMFQNSVTNGASQIQTLPNGTATTSGLIAYGTSDPDNANTAAFLAIAGAFPEARISSGITGTASYTDLTFYMSGSERMRLDTSGRLSVNTSTANTNSYLTVIGNISVASPTRNQATTGQIGNWTTDDPSDNRRARITLGTTAGASSSDSYIAFSTNQYGVSDGERMRIDASGNVGIGGTPTAFAKLHILGTYPTSSNTTVVNWITGTIPSGTTSIYYSVLSQPSTQAASFTLSNLAHFLSAQGTIGAGSAITNQYGFYADGNMTGATNNYGFYSNIASGSNRWNFYAAGTANNYFAGSLGVGSLPSNWPTYRLVAEITGSGNNAALFSNDQSATTTVFVWNKATSGDNLFTQFGTDGGATVRGSIDYDRANGLVRYNTTSDYRAKDVYGAWNDAGATIDALKVYRGKMHGATLERPMMIAHEAQAVVPYAVSGEKDAVDKDGKPKYQQMDHSVLVPLLIAELQAVRARLAALEAK